MTKYQKQPDIFETIFLAIGKGIWFVISYPFKLLFGKKKKTFDKISNFKKWLEIEQLLNSGDLIHAEQAVVRADKFFDNILKAISTENGTFADRLRTCEKKFSVNVYQGIWDAHKLRNKISHDVEYQPMINDCKIAVNKFRHGLENIGAI